MEKCISLSEIIQTLCNNTLAIFVLLRDYIFMWINLWMCITDIFYLVFMFNI